MVKMEHLVRPYSTSKTADRPKPCIDNLPEELKSILHSDV